VGSDSPPKTSTLALPSGCEAELFDREGASTLGRSRSFEQVRAFFQTNAMLLRAALAVRLPGFDQADLRAGAICYGLHCGLTVRDDVFFWTGVGWGPDDPPDLVPSWGVCLELDGQAASAFEADQGGLRSVCEGIAGEHDELSVLRVGQEPAHVELAAWRSFEWLLAQRDQRLALERFFIGTLDKLVSAGLPACLQRFLEA
jgi:hypothetical protein